MERARLGDWETKQTLRGQRVEGVAAAVCGRREISGRFDGRVGNQPRKSRKSARVGQVTARVKSRSNKLCTGARKGRG